MWSGVATGLRAGWSGFRVPVLASDFSRHQNYQTRYRTHLDSYSVATGVIFPKKDGLGVNETTHLHLMPRLSMSGAVRILPLYAFRRGQGKLCPFTFCAGYCHLSLRLVTRDEHTQPASFEGLTACLRKFCTSIYKPTKSSNCGCKRVLFSSKHRDRLRGSPSLLFRGYREFLPCG
jgi:hypothetical protein